MPSTEPLKQTIAREDTANIIQEELGDLRLGNIFSNVEECPGIVDVLNIAGSAARDGIPSRL